MPSWLTRGRTSLLQKDKSKSNVASNYRPINCLPLVCKLLTGVIAEQIYAHLDQEKLLPEEQKGCSKGSRGANDLLVLSLKQFGNFLHFKVRNLVIYSEKNCLTLQLSLVGYCLALLMIQ